MSRSNAKPSGYWTKEQCAEVAKKYRHRKDFSNGEPSAYVIALRNHWMNDICTHMTPKSSRLTRHVYEIADHARKVVYVGLTYDIAARACQHRASAKMQKHFPGGVDLHVLRASLSEVEAQAAEGTFVRLYESLGYTVLNTYKTGGLGGSKLTYTFKRCRDEALKYNTKAAFRKHARSAYARAHRRGWLDTICGHMTPLKKPNGYWTRSRVLSEVKKYKDYTSFIRESEAYQPALILKMISEVQCLLAAGIRKPRGYWTLETILCAASDCASYYEFMRVEKSACTTARQLGVIDKVKAFFDEQPAAMVMYAEAGVDLVLA